MHCCTRRHYFVKKISLDKSVIVIALNYFQPFERESTCALWVADSVFLSVQDVISIRRDQPPIDYE